MFFMNLRRQWVFLVQVGLVMGLYSESAVKACTVAQDLSGSMVMKSYDWRVEDLMFTAQAKGLQRTSLNLRGEGQPIKWQVLYNNMTFTQFGPGLPLEGINEAGLQIQILWLNSTQEEKPGPDDDRPVLSELEWIAFHLDSYRSVAEILHDLEYLEADPSLQLTQGIFVKRAKQKKLRLKTEFAKIHYFVCDAFGECAVFEWLDHQLRVTYLPGSQHPQALANDTYEESWKEWSKLPTPILDGKPGERPLERFDRVSSFRRLFVPRSLEEGLILLQGVKGLPQFGKA